MGTPKKAQDINTENLLASKMKVVRNPATDTARTAKACIKPKGKKDANPLERFHRHD